MPIAEPYGQLAAALRELDIPVVSAPDLGVSPSARGGPGIDYAGIAATVVAEGLRPPMGLASGPSSFYFMDAPGAPAPPVVCPPAALGLPTAAEFGSGAAIPAFAPGPRGLDLAGAPAPSAGSLPYARGLPTAAEFGAAGAIPAFASGPRGLDPLAARRDFPILRERVNGRELVWLDNAATTQKPASVIARLKQFYERENSNVHRGAHELAARATDAYEEAREKVRGFLNARSANEIVFVRGATEAINLVAQSWGRQNVGPGDEIIVSHLEHHANIVPWQQLAGEKGANLRVIPVDDSGQILFDEYLRLLTPRTKIVSVSQVSNALGTVTPVKAIVEQAKRNGIRTLVDGAQAVSHKRVDVRAIDCDWYVFSGHKVFAPTGIGVLYGREDLLNASPPWQGGGNMIKDVTFERTLYQDTPSRYEAGTGNIADAVGLGAAIDYVTAIGLDAIDAYEHQLLGYATHRLSGIPGLRIIGTAPDKAGVLSFIFDGFRTEDLGGLLNREGIAVRSGHHCAQPILRRFGLEATVRASLALYNTCADIDALVAALQRLRAGSPPRF